MSVRYTYTGRRRNTRSMPGFDTTDTAEGIGALTIER